MCQATAQLLKHWYFSRQLSQGLACDGMRSNHYEHHSDKGWSGSLRRSRQPSIQMNLMPAGAATAGRATRLRCLSLWLAIRTGELGLAGVVPAGHSLHVSAWPGCRDTCHLCSYRTAAPWLLQDSAHPAHAGCRSTQPQTSRLDAQVVVPWQWLSDKASSGCALVSMRTKGSCCCLQGSKERRDYDSLQS